MAESSTGWDKFSESVQELAKVAEKISSKATNENVPGDNGDSSGDRNVDTKTARDDTVKKLAAIWGSPSVRQYTTEVYLRVYLSGALAVTPNLQWVVNPSLNTDVESMRYFQNRARFAL